MTVPTAPHARVETIPEWRMRAAEAAMGPPHRSVRKTYRSAWIVALVGFLILSISVIIQSLYWGQAFRSLYSDRMDIDSLRSLSVLLSAASLLSFAGIILMVTCIVLVIRGLRAEKNRQRSGAAIVRSLRGLEAVALIALALYLIDMPLMVLASFLESPALMVISYSNPMLLAIAALPLLLAHALNNQ